MHKSDEPQRKKSKLSVLVDLLNPVLDSMHQGSQIALKQTAQNHPTLFFIPVLLNMFKLKQESEIEEISINKNNKFSFMLDAPNRIESFVGREKELEEIHKSFHPETPYHSVTITDNLAQRLANISIEHNSAKDKFKAAIDGLGGIGKTQLALMYAKKYDKNYDYIIWLKAEQLPDSFKALKAEQLSGSFKALLDKLKGKIEGIKDIDVNNKTGNDIAQEIYRVLQKQEKRSLFIFDNVENYREIEKFLPTSPNDKLHVLITSRWRNWDNVVVKNSVIDLSYFGYQETQDLIIKHDPKSILSQKELESFVFRNIDKEKLKCLLNKVKEESRKNNGMINSMDDVQRIACGDKELAKMLENLLSSEGKELEDEFLLYDKPISDLKKLIEYLEELLLEIEKKVSGEDQINELCKTFQGLPLALQQAIAYIKEERIRDRDFGIGSYLKEYKDSYEKSKNLLESKSHYEKNNDPYKYTVMIILKLAIEGIKKRECGEKAINILNVMAYLPPDNIPSKILEKLPRFEKGEFTKAISLLRSYSMVNQGEKSDLSSIHRLVQEVIRIRLTAEEKKKVFEEGFKMFSEMKKDNDNVKFTITNNDSDTISCIFFLSHATKYLSIGQIMKLISPMSTGVSREDFLKIAAEQGNVELVENILKDEQKGENFVNTLKGLLEEDHVQNSEIIKIFIKRDVKVDPQEVIKNKNCIEVLKALVRKKEFDTYPWLSAIAVNVEKSQQVIEYLQKNVSVDEVSVSLETAVDASELGKVKIILENWPNLVKMNVKVENGSILEYAKKTLRQHHNNLFVDVDKNNEDVNDINNSKTANTQAYYNAKGVLNYIEKKYKENQNNSHETSSLNLENSGQEMDFVDGYFSNSSPEASSLDSGFNERNELSTLDCHRPNLANELSDAMEETVECYDPQTRLDSIDVQQSRTRSGQVYSKS